MAENPFNTPRESRSVTLTFRMTPTEHKAVKDAADADGVEIVDLVREGLRLVLDSRGQRGKSAPRKERQR